MSLLDHGLAYCKLHAFLNVHARHLRLLLSCHDAWYCHAAASLYSCDVDLFLQFKEHLKEAAGADRADIAWLCGYADDLVTANMVLEG